MYPPPPNTYKGPRLILSLFPLTTILLLVRLAPTARSGLSVLRSITGPLTGLLLHTHLEESAPIRLLFRQDYTY